MVQAGWSGAMRRRAVHLFWLLFLAVTALAGRLIDLQVLQHERFLQLARAQQEGIISIPALRGEIRDRNNVVLATSMAFYSVAVNPLEVRDPGPTARVLGQVLRTDPGVIARALRGGGTFAWVARKVSDTVAEEVRELHLPGVFLIREPTGRRFYPKGRLASHLLGGTGIDDQGLDGLEAAFDKVLAGEPGVVRAYVDRDGWRIPTGSTLVRAAVPGRHLILTIDESIQYVAERELARAVKENHAKGGIVLVMDPRTAEILALAVAPDFPVDQFSRTPAEIRRNRALTDPYEPGSTFKVFLAGAALESGVDPDDLFPAGGGLVVDGWSIHNANDGLDAGGMESLTDIIAYSFNVGTANVALKIGKKNLYKHLTAFGFGSPTGIELPGEEGGLLRPLEEWADITTATVSFGQGVAVTPLQLISGLQAVANGGVRLRPHLVKAVVDDQGKVVKRFEPEELGRPMRPDKAAQLVEILKAVCQRGTGKRANIPGYVVAGKTGTAQVVQNGVYVSGRYIASFVGFVPAEAPRLCILVKIEEPGGIYWGGVVAAPVFSSVGREALWKLGVRPTRPLEGESAGPP